MISKTTSAVLRMYYYCVQQRNDDVKSHPRDLGSYTVVQLSPLHRKPTTSIKGHSRVVIPRLLCIAIARLTKLQEVGTRPDHSVCFWILSLNNSIGSVEKDGLYSKSTLFETEF